MMEQRSRISRFEPRPALLGMAILVFVLVAAACGGGAADDPDGSFGDSDLLQDDGQPGDTTSDDGFGFEGGGGGTLIFDGEEFPIDSVVCTEFGDQIEVGTVSDSGYRVFVSQNNPSNPLGAQILDPENVQWFRQGPSGDDAVRDGDTFSSDSQPYFNNNNDRTVQVSFTVECP